MTAPISTNATTGWISALPMRVGGRQLRNGPANSRAAKTGNPRTKGISGAPKRISGGASIISSHVLQHVSGDDKAGKGIERRGERDPEGQQPEQKT